MRTARTARRATSVNLYSAVTVCATSGLHCTAKKERSRGEAQVSLRVISVTRFCSGAITGDLPQGRVRASIDRPPTQALTEATPCDRNG